VEGLRIPECVPDSNHQEIGDGKRKQQQESQSENRKWNKFLRMERNPRAGGNP
jgi:hypothetical protein